ncbi:MAG: DinB family protein [Crocinitomicaceae bacterium]
MKDLNTELELFKKTRENILRLVETLSLDQINKIPDGFTGNIAWHLGHMLVTHKGLVYQLNSVAGNLDQEFVQKYKKDSKPEQPINQGELDYIKKELKSQVKELEEDVNSGDVFGKNIPYKTAYNYEITNLEDAVKFNNIHQAMHVGYILALKNLV